MFQKILLPIDLSDRHTRAVETAGQLASRSDGEVVLLHVIEVIPGFSIDEEKTFYGRLEKLAAVLKQRHVRWRQEILLGHRGAETVRYARENGFDLIIVTAPPVDPEH